MNGLDFRRQPFINIQPQFPKPCMRSILAALLRIWANWISPMATDPADPLTLSVTSDVGAVANFLDACVKVGLNILAVWDSPQMVQARANVAKQAAIDQNATDADSALKTGDMTQVGKDLS